MGQKHQSRFPKFCTLASNFGKRFYLNLFLTNKTLNLPTKIGTLIIRLPFYSCYNFFLPWGVPIPHHWARRYFTVSLIAFYSFQWVVLRYIISCCTNTCVAGKCYLRCNKLVIKLFCCIRLNLYTVVTTTWQVLKRNKLAPLPVGRDAGSSVNGLREAIFVAMAQWTAATVRSLLQ
jgi:hypothetical protein